MDFNDDENIEWLMESSKTVENVVENDAEFQIREQESLELYNFLQVLRSAFESEPALVDCKAKGTIKCEEDVQKLIKRLKALGYFFSIRNSKKLEPDKHNCKLMVVNKKNPPSSHPYRVISHTHYYCSYRNKNEQSVEATAGIENIDSLKGKKKLNCCKAVMVIRQIEIFTTVKLPAARKKRIEIFKKFRQKLAKDPNQSSETKYVLVISLPKVHNHSREVKGQQLNDEVKAAMHCILRSGVKSVAEIQQKLFQIVDQDFENDTVKPSKENSAFYPNQKIIYNHLRHDGLTAKKTYKKSQAKITSLKSEISKEINGLITKINECNDFEQLRQSLQLIQDIGKIFYNKEL